MLGFSTSKDKLGDGGARYNASEIESAAVISPGLHVFDNRRPRKVGEVGDRTGR